MTKKKKKSGKAKATGEGLEGILDRTNPAVSQSAEEIEAKMSGLFVGFATLMHKLDANTQERTTPDLKVPGDKRLRGHGRSPRRPFFLSCFYREVRRP